MLNRRGVHGGLLSRKQAFIHPVRAADVGVGTGEFGGGDDWCISRKLNHRGDGKEETDFASKLAVALGVGGAGGTWLPHPVPQLRGGLGRAGEDLGGLGTYGFYSAVLAVQRPQAHPS